MFRMFRAGKFHRRSPRYLICTFAVAVVNLLLSDVVQGQEKPPINGFILEAQGPEFVEQLDDFDRYVKRQAWERAFGKLQEITAKPPAGLITTGDGMLVAFERRLQRVIADLPPEGRRAYRIFYDAQAEQLLGQAVGDEERAKLEQIYRSFFGTTHGPQAADRLGDLYFEAGDYSGASQCWQAILRYHNDTMISRSLLLTKSAIALVRLQRLSGAENALRELNERHAGESVTLGGRNVDPVAHVDALLKKQRAQSKNAGRAIELPSIDPSRFDGEAAWKFQFFSEKDVESLSRTQQNFGPRVQLHSAVPKVAIDDDRVYVNIFGTFSAIDRGNGKLLWRTERFDKVLKNLGNQPYWAMPESYQLVAANGALWAIARPISELSRRGGSFYLYRIDPETGKTIWQSKQRGKLSSWSISGVPVITRDTIYVTGRPTAKATELHVVAVNLDGDVQWTTKIGAGSVDMSRSYYLPRTAVPDIVMSGDALFIETHQGALACLDKGVGRLIWGMNYETDVIDMQYAYNQVPESVTSGSPILHDGILYSKGMRSKRLLAIDPERQKVLWQRPVSRSEMLVSVDADGLVLGGEDVARISVKDRAMVWSRSLPTGTDALRFATDEQYLYKFTPRGVYILDRKSGKSVSLLRGSDVGSLGGHVFRVGEEIITVSNTSVSLYRAGNGDQRRAAD